MNAQTPPEELFLGRRSCLEGDSLEAEIAFAFFDADDAFFAGNAHLLVTDLRNFVGNHAFARFLRSGACVITQIFLHRHHGVGLAIACNGAVLGKFHETVARAAGTIARRAEARQVVIVEKPMHHFVKAAAVTRIELSRVFDLGDVLDRVTAHGRAGAPEI